MSMQMAQNWFFPGAVGGNQVNLYQPGKHLHVAELPITGELRNGSKTMKGENQVTGRVCRVQTARSFPLKQNCFPPWKQSCGIWHFIVISDASVGIWGRISMGILVRTGITWECFKTESPAPASTGDSNKRLGTIRGPLQLFSQVVCSIYRRSISIWSFGKPFVTFLDVV